MPKNFICCTWQDVQKQATQVAPDLAAIIDRLAPDKSFKLYRAKYPYGTIIGDAKNFYYPNPDKEGFFKLGDLPPNSSIAKDLGYAGNSIPAGMILSGATELFVDQEEVTIPCHLSKPGHVFALLRELDNTRKFHPPGIMTMSSGARSTFLLPMIGNDYAFAPLKKKLDLEIFAPKRLYDHWDLFKSIHNTAETPWVTEMLYFGEKWLKAIKKDPAWTPLRVCLFQKVWGNAQYNLNRQYYDYITSGIMSKINRKPDPYIANTIQHFLPIIVGYAPAYAPAVDDSLLPLNLLQNTLIDAYRIKTNPTIIQPTYLEPGGEPVYYSLNYPSTLVFTKRYKTLKNTTRDIHELQDIAKKYFSKLCAPDSLCAGTTVYELSKALELHYFHAKTNKAGIAKNSSELAQRDTRMLLNVKKAKLPFASFGTFIRGCVSLQLNKGDGDQS